MKKIFTSLLFFGLIILFSNPVFAQKDRGAVNAMIKTGSFGDFYAPEDYIDNLNSLKQSSSKITAGVLSTSFAYLNLFYEIEVIDNITISPSVGVDLGFDWFLLGARADYYFDSLIPKLPEKLELWGGADAGIILGLNGDKFMINGHVGGEWKFTDNWGVIIEGGVGTVGSSIGAGMSYHF